MLEFMDYVQRAFYSASRWDEENSYTSLTATAQGLLDFQTPHGMSLKLSSLSSPNFATSYALGSVGLVDGSLSFLYSSLPIRATKTSGQVDLHDVIRGYRQISELEAPDHAWMWEQWHGGKRIDKRDTLLYGRLYLPQSTLEALYMRRISPTQQFKLSAVSDGRLRNGGTLLAQHQYNVGKYSAETLYSTDGGLLGLKGLYNFGPDPRKGVSKSAQPRTDDRFYGRFSAGAELYYGAFNKSGGMSVGGRYTTLPAHKGIPLTATLTLNPLMGNISATYAVKAGENLSLCSRFDFNAYSYESDLVLGCELWRMKRKSLHSKVRSTAAKLEWRLDDEASMSAQQPEEVAGVFKARIDQNYKIAVLWEGRVKDFMFTLGSTFDMKRRDQQFRNLGLELQFSS
ncbi:MAG: Mitochondrial distribution and morphology protein 10 [Claussenomyces sp. TS43310]|nr:MAG: Mitochondrial distribution and morphology protein 10 [Claussenomyces sp. TS43310]